VSAVCRGESNGGIMMNDLVPMGAAKRLRVVFLVAVACDFALIFLRVLLYTPFLRQHNALVYILEPVILLIIYAGVAFATTINASAKRHAALRIGATVGLITGAMWIINLALETFSHLSGIPVTAPLLLGAFVLWGVAGFLATRQTGRPRTHHAAGRSDAGFLDAAPTLADCVRVPGIPAAQEWRRYQVFVVVAGPNDSIREGRPRCLVFGLTPAKSCCST